MRAALVALALALAAGPAGAQTPAEGGTMEITGTDQGMQAWIAAFRPRALAAGIPAGVFDRAMAGLRFDPGIVTRDRNQNEFTKTIWDYLDTAVSDARIDAGRTALDRHGPLLARIEAAYGVEKEIVTAVWGLESAYGTYRGDIPVLGALATLAYDGRRGAFFEGQLLDALRLVAAGDATPETLRGSWAGASGHTQFMPSAVIAHAVDFTGDGRRDLWGEDPADALASTAAYLKAKGWTAGQPWGFEVRLPEGYDHGTSGERVWKDLATWSALGITTADGGPLAGEGLAALLLPAGHRGAAFLIFPNFRVIETYNTADAYVIGIGHLADRLKGGPPIRHAWPREERALTLPERLELQERLTAAGFDTRGVDGKIGPNTIAAVRAWQRTRALVPDGFASLSVLLALRG
jgi:membrane-bound lytic murein transglycosylase B